MAAALMWPAASAGPAALAAPEAMTVSSPLTGTAFGGNAAVGALFTLTGGKPGTHFCTASVVDSPAGDMLVTAAHCVSGYAATSPANLAFVPGYENGAAPYGVWTVTRIVVDQAWAAGADPDDDVAFLVVQQSARGTEIQKVTGGERMGTGQPPAGVVRVAGYPDGASQPIVCQNSVSMFSPTQLQFDCANYTVGTSGSPLLADVDPATGDGTVVGVIGGYQQGGDSPDVSYAAAFGPNVQALYAIAESAG
jgi:V8-like Glu-specific endopeptidase